MDDAERDFEIQKSIENLRKMQRERRQKMEQREQDLTEEMRQAVAKILSDASANTEPELNPEEEAQDVLSKLGS